MGFENNDKKKLEDANGERITEKYSSTSVDLDKLNTLELNVLEDEMESIRYAINNNSLDLSEDEIIKLQNELELISNTIDEKSQSNSHYGEDETSSHEFQESSEDVGSNGDVDSIDENNSNFSVDDFVFEDVGSNGDVDSVDDFVFEDVGSNGDVDSVDDFVFEDVDSVDDVGSNGDVDSIDENNSNFSVNDALNDLMDLPSDEIAIKVENISMDFKVSMDKIDTLKEFVIRTIKRNKAPIKTVHALKNISFEITKGDRVGIIGFNGAGKSTLLKLLACVYYPTGGTIETKGKVAPLLELGAGFDNNYTGKDNIFLNGAFLGYSEDFLKEKYDEIVEFSELGDAINYHVKTYSSGMRAKLGFSIATIVEPDILILDEILSVGDIRFRRKSADKIKSLINSGITVLLVSHSVSQIRDLCNKAIWLDNGELKMMGNVNDVCDEYVKASTKATSEQLENLEFN